MHSIVINNKTIIKLWITKSSGRKLQKAATNPTQLNTKRVVKYVLSSRNRQLRKWKAWSQSYWRASRKARLWGSTILPWLLFIISKTFILMVITSSMTYQCSSSNFRTKELMVLMKKVSSTNDDKSPSITFIT